MSKKIGIGIISFAHMHAYGYASAIARNPNARLVAVADENMQRGREAAKQFGVRALYTDFRNLLKNPAVDAVVVCSENKKHCPHIIAAAEAKKHILCEKPITTTVSDAEKMISARDRNHVKLEMAFPVRFAGAAREVKQDLTNNAIGSLLAINATNHGKNPGSWFTKKKLAGGGAVMDHTVHVIDLVRWFTGAEPIEVYAEIGRLFNKKLEVDDAGILSVRFSNNMFLTLDASWSRPKSYPTWGDVTMEIVGTDGLISMDVFNQTLRVFSNMLPVASREYWGDSTDDLLIDDFVHSIIEDRPVSITAEDGVAAMRVALAAYESARKKDVVILRG